MRAYATIAEGNRVTSSDICFAASAKEESEHARVCTICVQGNYDWKAHLEDRARRERHGWGVDLTTLPCVPCSRKARAHVCIMHRAPSCLCIVPRRDRARARTLLSRLTDRRAGSWRDVPQRPGEIFSDARTHLKTPCLVESARVVRCIDNCPIIVRLPSNRQINPRVDISSNIPVRYCFEYETSGRIKYSSCNFSHRCFVAVARPSEASILRSSARKFPRVIDHSSPDPDPPGVSFLRTSVRPENVASFRRRCGGHGVYRGPIRYGRPLISSLLLPATLF